MPSARVRGRERVRACVRVCERVVRVCRVCALSEASPEVCVGGVASLASSARPRRYMWRSGSLRCRRVMQVGERGQR